MDDPADALLALSNTAAAIDERLPEEDERSSSLSELDDAADNVELEDDLSDEEEDENADEEPDEEEEDEDEEESGTVPVMTDDIPDGESEAETERLEESPDKGKKSAFQISPSKLAQTVNASDDVRPEIEELTDDASSPMTPVEDQDSDIEDPEEAENPLNLLSAAANVTAKRKRLSDVMDITSDERPRKRRTESSSDIEDESEAESEAEKAEPATREATAEPEELDAAEDDKDEAQPQAEPVAEVSDDSKIQKAEQRTRSRSRRGKDPVEEQEENEQEASDEDVEPEELEATAKSEEDQQRRISAMEALTALEKHFATLRDKLYDEKIALLNNELHQLSALGPTHTELLKQYECVDKWTENKQEIEQRRLVYRIESLKKESVGRRSQIHSAYFQTIRDVRERHLENMAEHFYRIQRERFKSTKTTAVYTIPFPEKKIDQVTQQTAYNKEVSILSGVAKYVGFPAAPDLQPTPNSELDTDLQKMGISSTSARIRSAAAATHRQSLGPYAGATSALASSAAAANASSEQQFIESTPWANPNHPIHRLGRQSANSSPFGMSQNYSTTPAPQTRRTEYTPAPVSGSTIVDPNNPTPGTDLHSSVVKHEPMTNGDVDGEYSSRNVSPTETRRTISNMLQAGSAAAAAYATSSQNETDRDKNGLPDWMQVGNSSPLQARASLLSSLNRTASAMGRDSTKSPFRTDLVAGGGMGRFGFR